MTEAPHPAAALLLEAVRVLADYRPADPADLAHLLRGLHNNVLLGALADLTDAISGWAETATGQYWANGEEIATWLERANGELASAGECLDYARHATGHWGPKGGAS